MPARPSFSVLSEPTAVVDHVSTQGRTDVEIGQGSITALESGRPSLDQDAISLGRGADGARHLHLEGNQQLGVGDAEASTGGAGQRKSAEKGRTDAPFRFVCWGPSKSPRDMSVNEMVDWQSRQQTPVIFNHHVPLEINSSTIQRVDLNPIKSTSKAVVHEERVLILTPLRDASPYLSKHFDLLSELTYPHDLIDLAFLVGDSTDDTLATLAAELDRIQKRTDKIPFHSALIVEKDFGMTLGQNDVKERHKFAAQGPRRKAMGRARNYLLSTALKAEHSWVYWRDVDIVDSPKKIIEDFVAHDKDILVPSTSEAVCLGKEKRSADRGVFRHMVPPIQGWSRYRRQM